MKWQETVNLMVKIPTWYIGVTMSDSNYYDVTSFKQIKWLVPKRGVVQGLLLPIIRDVNSRPLKEIKMALSQLQS